MMINSGKWLLEEDETESSYDLDVRIKEDTFGIISGHSDLCSLGCSANCSQGGCTGNCRTAACQTGSCNQTQCGSNCNC